MNEIGSYLTVAYDCLVLDATRGPLRRHLATVTKGTYSAGLPVR